MSYFFIKWLNDYIDVHEKFIDGSILSRQRRSSGRSCGSSKVLGSMGPRWPKPFYVLAVLAPIPFHPHSIPFHPIPSHSLSLSEFCCLLTDLTHLTDPNGPITRHLHTFHILCVRILEVSDLLRTRKYVGGHQFWCWEMLWTIHPHANLFQRFAHGKAASLMPGRRADWIRKRWINMN